MLNLCRTLQGGSVPLVFRGSRKNTKNAANRIISAALKKTMTVLVCLFTENSFLDLPI